MQEALKSQAKKGNDVIDFQYVEIKIRPISSFSFGAE